MYPGIKRGKKIIRCAVAVQWHPSNHPSDLLTSSALQARCSLLELNSKQTQSKLPVLKQRRMK